MHSDILHSEKCRYFNLNNARQEFDLGHYQDAPNLYLLGLNTLAKEI